MFRGIKSFLSGNYRVDLKTQQIQYFMIFTWFIPFCHDCALFYPIWNEPDEYG